MSRALVAGNVIGAISAGMATVGFLTEAEPSWAAASAAICIFNVVWIPVVRWAFRDNQIAH